MGDADRVGVGDRDRAGERAGLVDPGHPAAPVKLQLDPDLARIAEQTARTAADPVLISASLDATRTAATTAGQLREAYRISTERVALLASLDQDSPRAAAEIEDTYNMVCTDAIGVGDLPAALAYANQGREDDLVGNHPYVSMSTLVRRWRSRADSQRPRAGRPGCGWPGSEPATLRRGLSHQPCPRGWYAAYAQAAAAELAVVARLPDAGQRLAAAAPTAQQNEWAAACLARAAGRLRDDPLALATSVKGWERIGARFEHACTLLLLPGRASEGQAELTRLGVGHEVAAELASRFRRVSG